LSTDLINNLESVSANLTTIGHMKAYMSVLSVFNYIITYSYWYQSICVRTHWL